MDGGRRGVGRRGRRAGRPERGDPAVAMRRRSRPRAGGGRPADRRRASVGCGHCSVALDAREVPRPSGGRRIRARNGPSTSIARRISSTVIDATLIVALRSVPRRSHNDADRRQGTHRVARDRPRQPRRGRPGAPRRSLPGDPLARSRPGPRPRERPQGRGRRARPGPAPAPVRPCLRAAAGSRVSMPSSVAAGRSTFWPGVVSARSSTRSTPTRSARSPDVLFRVFGWRPTPRRIRSGCRATARAAVVTTIRTDTRRSTSPASRSAPWPRRSRRSAARS